MRTRNLTLLGVGLLVTSGCRPLVAQEPARHQMTLDASLFAADLTYARRTRSNRFVGGGIGVGYELNVRLVHGEPWGRKSTEIGRVELFERFEAPGRWEYDLGLKAAVDVHTAQVASEATPGGFVGAYVAPMWGGRRFRIGPRLQAGAYWSSARPSFGVSVMPLAARLLVNF